MQTSGKIAAALLSVACLAGAAGCSGDGGGTNPTQQAELPPAQRLAAARTALDSATSVHLRLTSNGVPKDATGVVSADGVGAHPPAFKGSFKVSLAGGVQADAEVTSVGGEVWAKLPLIPGTNKIDPASLGLPDPAVLFGADKGITTLLTATTAPTTGPKIRSGNDVLTSITGTIPGTNVVDLFLIGDRKGTFNASFGVTEANQLRKVELSGPFFAGTTSSYTLTLDKYGEPVTITKP